MFKKVVFTLLLITLIGWMPSCARRGNVTGGPKDSLAPQLVSSFPKNFSTQFSGNIIKLQFDEYVKLKDLEKQLVVSPPMNTAPEVTPQNPSKILTVKIKDTLQPNTTYSFNFGQSIQDNNEGNPYQQFRFVFSTGPAIDTLHLGVKIKDALERKTDNFVSVMLYEVDANYTDSIVFKKAPKYVANSLDSAKVVRLENLKSGTYRLVAIKDLNKNNRFDPQTEKIGFQRDFVRIPNDTVYQLELFSPQRDLRITSTSHIKKSRVLVGFQGAIAKASLKLQKGNEVIPHRLVKLAGKDSAEVWFNATKGDSLSLHLQKDAYQKTFGFKVKDAKKDSLQIGIGPGGNLPFRDTLFIKPSNPLKKWDSSLMRLVRKDSSEVKFTLQYNEYRNTMAVLFDKEPQEKYKFSALPGALTDWFEQKNDTLQLNTNTGDYADYGNLKLNLKNAKRFPILVELTDSQGKLLASSYSDKSSYFSFDLIQPNTFTVRIIYDDDKDGKWTPGNFMELKQSEEVYYYPEPIEVRMNWDAEQTIDLGP
jgi:uncharacterized protein (DUF2141 family)